MRSSQWGGVRFSVAAMLTIQLINDKHVPVITCDRCHQRIANHADAMVLYEEPDAPLQYMHHACTDKDTHQHLYSQPLDEAFVELVLRLEVDWDVAVRHRTKLGMLGE
jgi:hypothetical protein